MLTLRYKCTFSVSFLDGVDVYIIIAFNFIRFQRKKKTFLNSSSVRVLRKNCRDMWKIRVKVFIRGWYVLSAITILLVIDVLFILNLFRKIVMIDVRFFSYFFYYFPSSFNIIFTFLEFVLVVKLWRPLFNILK